MRSLMVAVICLAVLPLTTGCGRSQGGAGSQAPLKLTVVPYETADRLNDEYAPMAAYLAKRAGRPSGQFVSVVDYAGVLAALQSGQVDVAYLSSFPYALATARMKLKLLAMPYVKEKISYKGVFFCRADSPITKIEDLRGKTFAFGDISSTSGYLLPRAMLEKAGVFGDLKGWRNAGNANMVVTAVEIGAADAGAAYENVFEVAYRDNPAKAKAMRIFASTDTIPNGIYVARADLPESEVDALKKAFLDMNKDPEGKAAMLKAVNDKIVKPDDSLFDGVRTVAKVLKLDLKSLERKK